MKLVPDVNESRFHFCFSLICTDEYYPAQMLSKNGQISKDYILLGEEGDPKATEVIRLNRDRHMKSCAYRLRLVRSETIRADVGAPQWRMRYCSKIGSRKDQGYNVVPMS